MSKNDKNLLQVITFSGTNPLDVIVGRYLKHVKVSKGLNAKDETIRALLAFFGSEIAKVSGGSDLDVEIAARKSIIQLEAQIKLLTIEFGLDEGSDRVSDRQDSKKRSVSLLVKEEEEEREEEEREEEEKEEEEDDQVKPKTIFIDGFPPD